MKISYQKGKPVRLARMRNRVSLLLPVFVSDSIFAQERQEDRFELDQSNLKSLPDSHRSYTIDSVRSFWAYSLPKLTPPSQLSNSYGYDMADYRKHLAARNQFIAKIRAGEFDVKAECDLLFHNARLADHHHKPEEAARMRAQLKILKEGPAGE